MPNDTQVDIDALIEKAQTLANGVPNPCEGSKGHLADMEVNDFRTDLRYIRTDPTSIILKLEDDTYYNMQDLIKDVQAFIDANS
jgi:hypothetical protein